MVYLKYFKRKENYLKTKERKIKCGRKTRQQEQKGWVGRGFSFKNLMGLQNI